MSKEKAGSEQSMDSPAKEVMPRHIWDAKRMEDIVEGFHKKLAAGESIPLEWVSEHNDLLNRLNNTPGENKLSEVAINSNKVKMAIGYPCSVCSSVYSDIEKASLCCQDYLDTNLNRIEELLNRRPSRWGNVSIPTFNQDIKMLATHVRVQETLIKKLLNK